MSQLPPNIGVVPEQGNEGQQAQAEQFKNTVVEIQSRLFDKSSAFNNLIMLGGYAGAFTIWSYVKTSLSPRAMIVVALLLGLSLSVFIFFAVYKMAQSIIHYNKIRFLLGEGRTIAQFFEKLNELERQQARRTLQIGTLPSAICLSFCVLTSLGAAAILFYNFFAVLIGWPSWPE
jgi:hypothetical protein